MPSNSDFLYTFTGISTERVTQFMQTLLTERIEWESQVVERLTNRPIESLTGFVMISALAFYAAERHENPKINTLVDSLYYVSTSLSVGYADIFPVTQQGKLIATLVQAVGPAFAANALNPPQTNPAPSHEAATLHYLEAILTELRHARTARS